MTDEVKATEEKVESVEETKVETIDPNEYAELKAENTRLKEFHATVTQEKQAAVAKAKAEAEKVAKEKAQAEGDYKQLLELQKNEYQTQLDELNAKISSYEEGNKQKLINDTAAELAAKLIDKKTPNGARKAETLANILKTRLKHTDDGIKVTDAKGNIISEKLETLADFAKKEYDFLCDGLQSTGGAGVAVIKPTGTNSHKISEAEERALYKENPTLWRQQYGPKR